MRELASSVCCTGAGRCTEVLRDSNSDNGTNFKGAEKELQRLLVDINERMGKEAALKYDLQWHFNPIGNDQFKT